MSYYEWKPYVPVAVRRAQAERTAARAAKSGAALSPVRARGNRIATTFWGRAWCDNLERYSDFSNRLPRGRTYLRNGSVIDLKIEGGKVNAQVAGSSLYKTVVKVAAVPQSQWKAIGADCAGSIDSVIELLRGKLSQAVMARICTPGTGLFPAPKEISFECSCPDWASMCKHVAAVLYGVGVRLDQEPELLFKLRNVDAAELVAQAGAGLAPRRKSPAAHRVLDHAQLADVFGIEMAAAAPLPAVTPAAGKARKTPAGKTPAAAKTRNISSIGAAARASKTRAASAATEPNRKSAAARSASVSANKPAKAVARPKRAAKGKADESALKPTAQPLPPAGAAPVRRKSTASTVAKTRATAPAKRATATARSTASSTARPVVRQPTKSGAR